MRWRNATPLVSPLERLTYLKTVPLFSRLGPAEILVLAEQCSEMTFSRGTHLVRRDERPALIHIIVSGRATVRDDKSPVRTLAERDSVGLLAVLADQVEPLEAVALTRMRTLAIEARLLIGILEDRFVVYNSLLRSLCTTLREERQLILYRRHRAGAAPLGGTGDRVVDRMRLLQVALPFVAAHPIAIAQMASRATRVELERGALLWTTREAAGGVYAIVKGQLDCAVDDGASFVLGRGRACGFIDVIAARPRSYAASASQGASLLRIEREVLLDVFEDHVGLAMTCLRQVASALVVSLGERMKNTQRVPTGLVRHVSASHPVQRQGTLAGFPAVKPPAEAGDLGEG